MCNDCEQVNAAAVVLRGVSKEFDANSKPALKEVSLGIPLGGRYGFLGPNGSGKSTLIRIITGVLSATYGEVETLGHIPDINDNTFKKKLGVMMGGKNSLNWDLPFRNSYELHKVLYEIDDDKYAKAYNFINGHLKLDEITETPVFRLSLGQRMRAELGLAFLHMPELLILDEPSIGLDHQTAKMMREMIVKLNEDFHTTVIVTSHNMADVEEICNHVVLLKDGGKIYDGKVEDLRKSMNVQGGDLNDIIGQIYLLEN